MKTKNALRSLASAVVLQFGLFAALAIASAQTIVTSLADNGPGTLRQAIANAQPGEPSRSTRPWPARPTS